MQFGSIQFSISQSYNRLAFHLAPISPTKILPQFRPFVDAVTTGYGFDIGQRTDDLEFIKHAER